MESLFTLTDSAKSKIIEILEAEKLFQGRFRIYLSLSNSTGYQYAFVIDNEVNDDDLVLEYEYYGTRFDILVDSMTIQYLKDATVDCKQKETETMLVITSSNTAKE